MSETSEIAGDPNRRTVVAGMGAAGLAAALTACSGSSDSGSGGGDQAKNPGSGKSGGEFLAATSAIPTGGGKIFKNQKVVVTQPTEGKFKAFTAVCPHQGCLVTKVADGLIICPCHKSEFSTTDGSRQAGPATEGLSAAKLEVQNDHIKLV
jgi:nitrite reductase/ring-hydroxylating ferredoxin subunit